jgi:hypothetical protein
MDPFIEKDMIDCLRSMASSLRNMDRKMDELTLAVREIGLGLEGGKDDLDDSISSEDEIKASF